MKAEIYNRPERVHRSRGLTVLEVMLALGLFAVGILAMATLAGTSMHGITAAQLKLFDSAAAANQMESMLARSYTDPVLQEGGHAADFGTADRLPFGACPSGSTIEWEVQTDFPTTGAKLIRLTVRHPFRGQMRETTYAYVKARDFR